MTRHQEAGAHKDILAPVEPLGLLNAEAARLAVSSGAAIPFLGGPLAFSLYRQGDSVFPAATLQEPERERLTALRPHWAGFARPAIMGIINVTPDSFSDSGDRFDVGRAVADAEEMLAQGADILDIGGESTRPGSVPVPPEEEQRRILPVISALAARGAVISVDTRNASTMRKALDAGGRIFNDVSGLTHDSASLRLAAEAQCPVVLMHMRGTPATMMDGANTAYENVVEDVFYELQHLLNEAEKAGIRRDNIALDPGIGFAKLNRHSVALLDRLPLLATLGCRLLIGVSRKGMIAALAGDRTIPPKQRMPGSVAVALHALSRGADILRVHDVAETVQAVKIWMGLEAG
ncbi:Dihydropteroate synthase [Granulibacter bethesdensis]|uniref:Dihydropteroate synthase n=1 Tax=Granulibacter bethesdensis TaxID=364410 RepID=A0AAN0RDH4_9PROT|nr:dihydropteroate synthase [Granulibacter bethesdensis]AHJ62938.1 Dihydropteroate synthase [Granulibacter bethesdensis]